MALTDAQKATLKAFIEADGTLNAFPNNSDGAFAIAAIMNPEAVPAFVVWRTDVSTSDVKKSIVWTEYISASIGAGDRDAMNLIISNGIVDSSDTNIRAGFGEIFKNATTTRDALLAISKRNANSAEELFATGTGSDAVPATMDFEGNLSYQDVLSARNS